MWSIFKYFDVDDTDSLSKDNVRDAMNKLGKKITDEELNAAFKLHANN